jgi:hypothetical protein
LFIDEYNTGLLTSDAIRVYKTGNQVAAFSPSTYIPFGFNLDDNKVRKWELIVDGPQASRWVTVTMNDIIMYRANIGAWTPTGAFYGAWGFTGGAINRHSVPAIGLRPAKMWKMQQGLI